MAARKKASAPPSLMPDDRKWRARDALSTLTRAQEIQSDSKLMADVKREASRQQQAIAKATGAKASKPSGRK